MVESYSNPLNWERFPPTQDRPRLDAYKTYRDLLLGEHEDVFKNREANPFKERPELARIADAAAIKKENAERPYVATNYCALASKIFANALFGVPPKFKANDEGDLIQQRLDAIIETNMLDAINHQQAIEASSLGDAVYRVRWGSMNNWREQGAVIEAIPAAAYFPILTPGNVKDNRGAVLAYTFAQGDNRYLYKETHMPGQVRYEVFSLDGETIKGTVPLGTFEAYAPLIELASGAFDNYVKEGDAVLWLTGYQGLFVEHVTNWTKPDTYFGISDYAPDIISNQGAINDLQSGILNVCLTHMNPKLVMPEGTMSFDVNTGKWFVRKEDLDVVETANDTPAHLPRYVTWDAQLAAAKNNIQDSFEAMMMSFQISPSIFGNHRFGAADSAAALKLRMTQTLWSVGQKRMYFDAALKNILYAALYLDGKYGPVRYDPVDVSITWGDPMPIDEQSRANTAVSLIGAKLLSRETAITNIQGIEGEALAAELERIARENRVSSLTQLAATGAIAPQDIAREMGIQSSVSELSPFPQEE